MPGTLALFLFRELMINQPQQKYDIEDKGTKRCLSGDIFAGTVVRDCAILSV